MEDRVTTLEKTIKQQEQTINSQQKLIQELMTGPKASHTAAVPDAAASKPATTKQMERQVQELNEKVDRVADAQKKTLPSEFNPAIGIVGETVFSYRSKDSSQTGSDRPGGFDAFQRSVELNATASVDPFAKAYLVANASADANTGESTFNIEEAALQTTSLPWDLTVKVGRFFGEFGRLSYIHDHELPFVNRPLVLNQYIGGESRTDGAQINWLAPLDHYLSITGGVGNQFGGDNPPNGVGNFRNLSGWNFWGRLSSSFDLTPNTSLEPGISGLWNPESKGQWSSPGNINPTFPIINGNSLTERERRLVGADLTLSYKPLRNNQFNSIIWGTEVLYSDNRYDAGDADGNLLSSSTVGSWGLYSYLTYKFDREWSAGFLYGFVENALDNGARSYEYSPYVTLALSHWNQLRLQYTHTDHNAYSGLEPDDAVYLQWSWIIGSHSHGWQER
ncbi:MAG: hypothetical protein HQK59_14215 [Deltaproteobacteria bacterium]|nr:hypothetical protein [Deltaproteobacteria bacterium]